jgi:IS5 family transposase
MKRGARDHPIGIRDKIRNLRISRKRSKGERPFAVIKNICNYSPPQKHFKPILPPDLYIMTAY